MKVVENENQVDKYGRNYIKFTGVKNLQEIQNWLLTIIKVINLQWNLTVTLMNVRKSATNTGCIFWTTLRKNC